MSRLPRPICAGSIAAFLAAFALVPDRTKAATVYWDTNSTGAGAGGATPSGTWSSGSTVWNPVATGLGTTAAWNAGDIAVFSAGSDATGAYTVTVSGTQSIGGLVFEDGTTTLTGGTLNVATASDFLVNGGVSAFIDSTISGSASIRKTGIGSLRLGSASNSFTGTLTISSGVLSVTSVGALGAGTSPITVEGNNNRGQGGGQLVLGGSLTSGITINRSLLISGGGPGAGGAALLSVGNNTITDLTTGATASNIPYASGGTTTVTSFVAGVGQNTQFNGPGNWILSGVNLSGQTNTLLQKAGSGGMIITGTNLIDNELRASGGSLRIANGAGLPILSPDSGVLEVRTDNVASFADTRLIFRAASTTANLFVDRAVGSTGGLLNQTLTFSDSSFANVGSTLNLISRNGYGVTLTGAGSESGNIPFATGGNVTIGNSLTGLLTFAGNLSFTDSTTRTYTIQGNGDSKVTGNILGPTNPIPNTGVHVLAKGNNGTLTLLGTASTYAGGTNVNAGTLAATQLTATGNGILNLGTGTTGAGTFSYLGAAGTGAGETNAKLFNLAGSTANGILLANQAGSSPTPLMLTGGVSATGAGTKTLFLGGTSTLDNTLSGLIQDNSGTNKTSVTKIGGGTWVYSPPVASFSGGGTATTGAAPTSGAATTNSAQANAGQSDITLADVTGIVLGQLVTGTNIPTNSTVTAINGSTITISNPLSANVTNGTALTFGTPTGVNTFHVSNATGIAVGQLVTGANIPANSTVTAINGNTITINTTITSSVGGGSTLSFGSQVNANSFIVSTLSNVVLGQTVSGTNVPAGSVVSKIDPATNTVTISSNITSSIGAGNTITFGPLSSGFTGGVTVAGGTIKFQPTATSGVGSNLIGDTSTLTFDADTLTGSGSAGGTFELVGSAAAGTLTETLGTLTLTNGAGTVKITAGAGTPKLTFGSLGTVGTGTGLNFVGASPTNPVTITGTSGFLNSHVYFDGADFAYSGASAALRAINYGGDAGTNTVAAAGTLTASSHNLINTTSGASGTVTQNAGVIVGSLKFSGNTTLTGTGQITTPGILVTGGAASIASAGGITTGGATDLVVRVDGASDTLTLTSATAILSSTTGGLTKNGAGKLVFGGNQSYTGTTTINEGTLQLTASSRLGTGSNNLIVRQGATLDLNGVTVGATVGAFNGSGNVTNTSGTATTLTIGGGGASGVFSGLISSNPGSLGVTKTAAGTISLTGLNTYTGATQITGGTLVVNSLADGGVASSIGASTNAAANLVFNAGTLQYTGANLQIFQATQTPSVSTNRLFTLAGNATIDSSGTFGNNVLVAGVQNNASLVFSNTGAIAFSGAGTRTLTLQGSSTGDNELRPQLTNNSGSAVSLTKTNGGLWILNPAVANSYTGLTTISGGQLQAVDGVGVPTTSPIVLNGGSAVFQTSGTFTRSINAAPVAGGGGVNFGATGGGFAASSTKLTVNIGNGSALTWGTSAGIQGTLYLSSGTAVAETEFQNSIDLGAATRSVQVDDNGNTALDFAIMSGVLSNGGLTKTNTGGILFLTGANTYASGTTLNGGTLVVNTIGNAASASSNLGAGSGALTLAGGTLMYVGSGENTNRTINLNASASIDASGSGPLVFTNLVSSAGAKTLTLTGASSDVNEARMVLADNGGALTVTKGGAGIWVLSGANSYTGPTNVTAGSVGISNDSAFGQSSSVIVTNASLFAADADHTISRPVLFSGNATEGIFGDYNLTINGAVTFANSTNSTTLSNFIAVGKTFTIGGTVTNADGSNNRSLTINGTGNTLISGVVQDNSGTSRTTGLIYSGTGQLTLTGPNTYTGTTTAGGGVIQAQDATGLPSGSNLQLNGGVFQITGPFTRALGTGAGQVQWVGSGGFAAVGGDYTLNLSAGLLVWGGGTVASGANPSTPQFITGTNSLIFGSTTADSVVNWTNQLDLNNTTGGVTRTIVVNDNPAVTTDYVRINPGSSLTQSGSGATALTKNGAGKLIIEQTAADNSNSFAGTLTVNGGDLIIRGTPTNGGALTMSPSATGTNLVLENGASLLRQGDFNASAGSAAGGITVSGNGSIRLNATAGIVTRNFVINDNPLVTDDVVISVPLQNGAGAGVVHLTKQGAGKLVLSGNNTYAGATVHFKGTTVIDYGTSATEKLSDQGDLEMRGGNLILKGNNAGPVSETVGNLSPGSSNLGLQNAVPNTGPSTATPNSYGTLTGTASQGAGGLSTIQLQPTATRSLRLTFNGFIRNPGGGVTLLSTTNANGEFHSAVAGDMTNGNLLAVNALLDGRWIAQDGFGKIVRHFGTVQNDPGAWDSTHTFELSGQVAGSGQLNTDRIAGLIFSGTNSNFTINNATASLTLSTAGLLVAPESTASLVQVIGGKLMTELPYKTAAGADILLENFSTGVLRVASNLGHSDGPQGNTPFITIAGTGIVELAGKSSSMLTYGTNGANVLRGAVKVIGGATLRMGGSDMLTMQSDAISDYVPIDFGTAGDLAGNLQLNGWKETIGGILNPPSTNQGVNNPNIDLGSGGALTLNQLAAVTYNGTITGNGTFIKDGNATFTITNTVSTPQTFGGAVEVRGGLLSLTGNLTNGLTGAVTDIILRGGSIEAEHNGGGLLSINKLPDTAKVTLDGTFGNGLRIFSNTSGRTESIAAANILSGANVITVDSANTTSQLTLNLTKSNLDPGGALTRGTNHGTLLVRGDNLGGGLGGSLNNTARILLGSGTNGLGLVGGTGSTPTNYAILPWAIGTIADPVATAVGDSFVTYGPNGLRPLNTAPATIEYATNYATAAATDNLSLNSSQSNLPTATVNALRLDTSAGAISLNGLGGATLTVTSGAILVTAGATANGVTLSNFSNVFVGSTNELVISVTSSNATPTEARLTFNPLIQDNGIGNPVSVTKTGTGTLVLTANNTFSGGININQGVVEFSDTLGGRDLGVSNGAVRLAGGTLRYAGPNPVNISAHPIELLGPSSYYTPSGTGATGNALSRGSVIDTGPQNVTISGPSGTGGLIKLGTTTLTVSTPATYTGSTAILQGTMNFNAISGMSGLYLLPENIGGVDNVMVNASVTNGLDVNQLIVGGVFTSVSTLSGTGTLTVGDATHHPAVTIGHGGGDSYLLVGYHDEGAANGAAGTSKTKGVVNLSNAGPVTIDVSRAFVGQNKGAGSGLTDGDLTLSNNTNNIKAGFFVIGDSPGPDATGGGVGNVSTVTLGTGTNFMNVDSLIIGGQNSNGKLVLGAGGSLVLRDRTGSGGANVFIGDNDDINDRTQSINDTTFDTTGPGGPGGSFGTVDAMINLLVIGRHGGSTSPTNLAGGGRGSLRFHDGQVNAATVLLAQTDYRGLSSDPTKTAAEITQDGGTFRFGNMSKGGGDVTYNWNSGVIENFPGLNAVNSNVRIDAKPDFFGDYHNISVPGGYSMTFGNNAGIDGTGFVIKTGGGTLILKGSSNYSGGTEIQAGTVFANNTSGSATGTDFVRVLGGAELGGSGSIGGSVQLATGPLPVGGGKLSVGPNPGEIGEFTIEGDLDLEENSVLKLEIQTAGVPMADLLHLGGSLNVDTYDPDNNPLTTATLSITDLASAPLTKGDTLTIIDSLAGWNGVGLFKINGSLITDYDADTNPFSTMFNIGAYTFQLDYNGGLGGNEVQLVAVPEPGALASLIGGMGMLLGLQRFRRWNAKG